jgi:hypothetical protein
MMTRIPFINHLPFTLIIVMGMIGLPVASAQLVTISNSSVAGQTLGNQSSHNQTMAGNQTGNQTIISESISDVGKPSVGSPSSSDKSGFRSPGSTPADSDIGKPSGGMPSGSAIK